MYCKVKEINNQTLSLGYLIHVAVLYYFLLLKKNIRSTLTTNKKSETSDTMI